MSSHQRFDVLNGAGRVGLVHWRRVYLRNANLWMELERFSLDRITLPYGGEGYGHNQILGECEECGIGLAAWRNCQHRVRHSASSHPLACCLACELQEHIRAWDQTRCPEHGGSPFWKLGRTFRKRTGTTTSRLWKLSRNHKSNMEN